MEFTNIPKILLVLLGCPLPFCQVKVIINMSSTNPTLIWTGVTTVGTSTKVQCFHMCERFSWSNVSCL